MNKTNENIVNEFFLSQWITGELSAAELQKLVSADDFIAYQKLKKGVDLYAELEKPLDSSFENIKAKLTATKEIKVRTLNYKWLASIAAMVIFFVGFYSILGNDLISNTSHFGEQINVALLDGSSVTLNAKSTLNYSKKEWKKNRIVYLKGEAFFKVSKGNKFTVKTKNGNITVLGTQFTVKSTPNFFEVICFEGSVRVEKDKKVVVLKPTESFRKINGNAIESLTYKVIQPTWLFGESTYKSVPLKYIISDFEKQYNVKINSNKIDDSIIFTGSFYHKDINLALKTVFKAIDISFKKIDSNTIVLYK